MNMPHCSTALPARDFTLTMLHDLIDVARPDSCRNPYRHQKSRWRNWVLINLMARAGVRCDEAAAVRCPSASTTEGWQSRAPAPLLTIDGGGRGHRPARAVPMSASLYALVLTHCEAYRPPSGSALLFADGSGRPISKDAIWVTFERFSDALCDATKVRLTSRMEGKKFMTPRQLHHRGVHVKCMQFSQEASIRGEAIERAKAFFGWRTNDLAEHFIGLAIDDRLLRGWDGAFDLP